MPRLRKSEFADYVGVKRPSITKAVDKGHIVVGPDGLIDTDAPENAPYIAARQQARVKAAIILPSQAHHPRPAPKPAAAKNPEPRIDRGPPPGSSEAKPPIGDTVSPPKPPRSSANSDAIQSAIEKQIASQGLDSEKKRAQIQLWRAQRDRHQLMIAEKKGELLPREIERRRWSAFDAALKTHLRDFPRRASARLHALALSDGPRALETALEAEVSEILARVVQAAKEQKLS